MPSSTFILIDTAGVHQRTVARLVAGDWRNPLFRQPFFQTHDLQHGPEDITRRLRADGDSGFFHVIQPNEHDRDKGTESFDLAMPPAFLIRYSLDLVVKDTVAVMRVSPLTLGTTVPGALPDYWQDVFGSRPLYASGDGSVALAHRDSSFVAVRQNSARAETVVISWPDDRPEIKIDDRMALVQWTLDAGLRRSADFAKEWARSSRAVKQAAIDEQLTRWMRFSPWAPDITSLFGAGQCLFATGFSAYDYVDGTARTIIAINIASGKPTVLRLASRGETIHDIDSERIATTRRNEDGEWFIRIYQHGVDCSSSTASN